MLARNSIFLLTSVLVLSFSCKREKEDDPVEKPFNKEVMLKNIGQNVALASYEKLNVSLTSFDADVQAFLSAKSQANLDAARESFKQVYLDWQHCSPFEFGPAADVALRLSINTFPVDDEQIESNIGSGSYSLTSAQNADAKALPALEYLLFNGSLTDFEDQNRVKYLQDNLEFVKSRVSQVVSDWNSGYLETFASNTGSDVGSSIGQLVNEINYDYELIKNAKIGIPLGKKSLGEKMPEKVEALYSGWSKDLALANLEGIRNAYTGNSGLGLDDQLDALGAKYEGQDLSDAILDGFAEAESKINAIPGTMHDAITNDPTQVEEAYNAIQSLVVLLKTDMPSQLGVQITYQDNDGD